MELASLVFVHARIRVRIYYIYIHIHKKEKRRYIITSKILQSIILYIHSSRLIKTSLFHFALINLCRFFYRQLLLMGLIYRSLLINLHKSNCKAHSPFANDILISSLIYYIRENKFRWTESTERWNGGCVFCENHILMTNVSNNGG